MKVRAFLCKPHLEAVQKETGQKADFFYTSHGLCTFVSDGCLCGSLAEGAITIEVTSK